MNGAALDGLRVIEIGGSDAVRYCGMHFADFGATVLQLPDIHACWQPHPPRAVDYFGRMLDRGKCSAQLPDDPSTYLAGLRRWLSGADILIDGSAHGGLPAAGLSYESLRRDFPQLVIAAISLAGREAPSAHLDGCELIAAARASDLQMTGMEGGPPTRSASPKAEMYAGLMAFCGALAKLRVARTQGGGVVDIALSDVMLAAMEGRVEHYFEAGRTARRVGNRGRGYGIYEVADGYVALGIAGSDRAWQRFCELIGRPDAAEHPLLKDAVQRRQNPELVEAILDEWLAQRTRSEVVAALRSIDLNTALVLTIPEVVQDPQVEAMAFIVEGGDGHRTWRCGGYPIELSLTPALRRMNGAEQIGEHWPARDMAATASGGGMATPTQPLAGLLVLEFGSGIAGPYGTLALGDLGARVVKIEEPSGAWSRFLNFCGSRRRNGDVETVLAGSYRERNKESIQIDLRADGAKDVVDQLVSRADVVVANLAPSALERMGFGAEWLLQVNPRLIVASITGFGHRGPLRDLRGVDLLALAHSGFASLTGMPDDPPTRSGQSYSDYLAGLALAAGILVALHERDRSGKGQVVRTSLLGMALTTLGGALEEYLETGVAPSRTGTASHRFGARCALWEARDGQYVAVDVTAPAARAAFSTLRRRGVGQAMDGSDEAIELAEFVSGLTAQEAALRLQEAGVPAAVAGDLRTTAAISDFWTRGMFRPWNHPHYGTLVFTGSPLRLDGEVRHLQSISPWPGEHTEHVLRRDTSFSDERIDRLFDAGVVVRQTRSL